VREQGPRRATVREGWEGGARRGSRTRARGGRRGAALAPWAPKQTRKGPRVGGGAAGQWQRREQRQGVVGGALGAVDTKGMPPRAVQGTPGIRARVKARGGPHRGWGAKWALDRACTWREGKTEDGPGTGRRRVLSVAGRQGAADRARGCPRGRCAALGPRGGGGVGGGHVGREGRLRRAPVGACAFHPSGHGWVAWGGGMRCVGAEGGGNMLEPVAGPSRRGGGARKAQGQFASGGGGRGGAGGRRWRGPAGRGRGAGCVGGRRRGFGVRVRADTRRKAYGQVAVFGVRGGTGGPTRPWGQRPACCQSSRAGGGGRGDGGVPACRQGDSAGALPGGHQAGWGRCCGWACWCRCRGRRGRAPPPGGLSRAGCRGRLGGRAKLGRARARALPVVRWRGCARCGARQAPQLGALGGRV
jgi:hypothetical protein